MRRAFLAWALALLFLSHALADVYMHYPRGSNNKLNEVSNTVNNGTDPSQFKSWAPANGGITVGSLVGGF